MAKKSLSAKQRDDLLDTLETRFAKNMARHEGLDWSAVAAKLSASDKLWSLNEMERTGGEPDVIGYDKKTKEFIFADCSAESPKDRRSVCYDRAGLKSRKDAAPAAGAAIEMAEDMGIELLTEEQYRELQQLGEFDLKTSSWLKTPAPIRKLGGAIFGDRRYDTVFVYHNGAQSFYAARGFRGTLKV